MGTTSFKTLISSKLPTKPGPNHFDIVGDAAQVFAGSAYEFSSMGVALDAGRDANGDGKREGSVSQDVPIASTLPGRWFRFKIRGLPEDGFAVGGDHLHMKVDFFGDHGKRGWTASRGRFIRWSSKNGATSPSTASVTKAARRPGKPMRSSSGSLSPTSTRSA